MRVFYENGERVVRDAMPDDEPPLFTAEEIAEAVAKKELDEGKTATKAIGMVLAEVVFRVSNGTIPQNITRAQARTWVRDTFKENYQSLL